MASLSGAWAEAAGAVMPARNPSPDHSLCAGDGPRPVRAGFQPQAHCLLTAVSAEARGPSLTSHGRSLGTFTFTGGPAVTVMHSACVTRCEEVELQVVTREEQLAERREEQLVGQAMDNHNKAEMRSFAGPIGACRQQSSQAELPTYALGPSSTTRVRFGRPL
jgi:hypothetical protein